MGQNASGTGSFICPVAYTRLDIPSPLIRQSWTTAWHPPASWNLSHMINEGVLRAGLEPTAVNDLLITSQLTASVSRVPASARMMFGLFSCHAEIAET